VRHRFNLPVTTERILQLIIALLLGAIVTNLMARVFGP
jgi:tetrahydromethanopterin S-methyltransferase subunit C